MNNIVLGHSGFIGSHTYKFLKNKGLKVIGGNTKNCNLLNKKDKHQIQSSYNSNIDA